MPKLPRISGAEAIRALERLGFRQARQRGSHVVLKTHHRERNYWLRSSTASGAAIDTLRGILKQAGAEVEEFIRNL